MPDRPLELVVKNVRVVRPGQPRVERLDLGVAGGRFVRLAPDIPAAEAAEVYDARGRLGFPGVVDAHTHVGIYGPLADDAVTESRAAVSGGVTTMLTYFRTGQYYLNRSGPYAEFFPEVLRLSDGRYHCDYGYHLAPITAAHVDEMEALATRHGVPSFKIFMFYGGYGLHGQAGPDAQRRFLMIGPEEHYDLAHFEFVLRAAGRVQRAHPARAEHVSVSLHCEVADILDAYTRLVARDPSLSGLRAYSAARPPHAEGLAVWIAAYLASEAACANVNLLHLSSRKAIDAALQMQAVFPHVDFRREVTIGHLILDVSSPSKELAKVNPPIRPREDVEYLWEKLLEGKIDWVVSDHACCRHETKVAKKYFGNIWMAKSGFGGTEYLLPALVSEGMKRGLSLNRIAALLSLNPAKRFGLNSKGDIAEGLDADLALVDPRSTWTIRAKDSESTQGYTPFEGIELGAKVKATFLRGSLVCENGNIVGKPKGKYLKRPTA